MELFHKRNVQYFWTYAFNAPTLSIVDFLVDVYFDCNHQPLYESQIVCYAQGCSLTTSCVDLPKTKYTDGNPIAPHNTNSVILCD